MQEPVHVTVQMATVGLPVEVSALHEIDAVYGVSGICIVHSSLHEISSVGTFS